MKKKQAKKLGTTVKELEKREVEEKDLSEPEVGTNLSREMSDPSAAPTATAATTTTEEFPKRKSSLPKNESARIIHHLASISWNPPSRTT